MNGLITSVAEKKATSHDGYQLLQSMLLEKLYRTIELQWTQLPHSGQWTQLPHTGQRTQTQHYSVGIKQLHGDKKSTCKACQMTKSMTQTGLLHKYKLSSQYLGKA